METYTLVPQMRRCAISVLANLVEGYSKESPREFARFLTISIGSITELEVYLEILPDLGYLESERLAKINTHLLETKRLLYGTRKSIKNRIL